MGDANASIPTPQPVLPRAMFGAVPRVAAGASITYVAPGALEQADLADRQALGSTLVPVRDCRSLSKDDLPENTARPDVRVDADTFAVTIDGELVEAAPVAELPMAQRYFLF